MAVIFQTSFEVQTQGRETRELTPQLAALIRDMDVRTGIAQLFVHHTSASLMLCENADPDVRRDLEVFMSRLAPDGDPAFVHTLEGPDDMPAHVRSVLTGADVSFPVRAAAPDLGVWQGVYLWEHRRQGHRRRLTLTVYGE